MWQIRDVYLGSEFLPSRIRIKEFKYFNPKKWFLSSREYDPDFLPRIRIPDSDFYPSRIPGSTKHRIPDPQHCYENLNLYRPARIMVLYRKGSEIIDVPGPGTYQIWNTFGLPEVPSIPDVMHSWSLKNIFERVLYTQFQNKTWK